MNREVEKNFKKILQEDVNNFENYSLDEDKKIKGLNTISKEIKVMEDVENARFDRLIKRKKINFDIKKQEQEQFLLIEKQNMERDKLNYQIKLDNDKLILENEKFKLDKEKLTLDINKFKNDISNKKDEKERAKIDRIINITLRILEIGVPLLVYSRLVMKNFRLVYADDGRIPSEMRDLMKNVYRGKI